VCVWVGFGGLRPRRGGDGAGAARLLLNANRKAA
jgi:hypothetical protein